MFHSIPAYMMDMISYLLGKKPVMVTVVNKMHRAQKVIPTILAIILICAVQAIEYFSTNEWSWTNENVQKLYRELSKEDQNTFNFDLSALHWPDFIADYVKVQPLYIARLQTRLYRHF